MVAPLIKSCIFVYFCTAVFGSIVCPSNNKQWRERAEAFNCVLNINGTYHCVIALNGSIQELRETCMSPSLINSNEVGCPKIRILDGIPRFSRPFLRCKDDSGLCPRRNHRLYYTDQLYEYPECIRPELQETTVGVTTEEMGNDFTSTMSQPTTTKPTGVVTTKDRCDCRPVCPATIESHDKPIEILSLLLLIIAVISHSILLFCPARFRRGLEVIQGKFMKSGERTPTRRDDTSIGPVREYNAVSVVHEDESTNL